MSLRAKQNAEVYEEMISSGKSLLELYIELKTHTNYLTKKLETYNGKRSKEHTSIR
jgi:uncharacterized protein Yka (UPF0111/DUF47 family)